MECELKKDLQIFSQFLPVLSDKFSGCFKNAYPMVEQGYRCDHIVSLSLVFLILQNTNKDLANFVNRKNSQKKEIIIHRYIALISRTKV